MPVDRQPNPSGPLRGGVTINSMAWFNGFSWSRGEARGSSNRPLKKSVAGGDWT